LGRTNCPLSKLFTIDSTLQLLISREGQQDSSGIPH
jgi:hypothetical protein